MKLLTRIFVSATLIAVILLAVIMGGIRLAISNLEYFKSEIEYLIERDVAAGFVFTGLSGAMNRFNPILAIENVSITLPDRSQPLFIDRLAVEFDFWASLRQQAPVVQEISGRLEKIELIKDADGKWWANEFALAGGGGEISMPGFHQLLALVPRYLKLDLNRLLVLDQQTDSSHQLQRVQAFIDHRDDQFFMKLSASLPDQLGRGLLVKSVVGPKRSLIYINSSDLRLNPVARLFDLDTWGVQQGALDGEIWINMSGYQVLAVNGVLVLKNGLVQMAPDKTPLQLSYHSRFNAVSRNLSWQITNKFERLQVDGNFVPAFRSQFELAGSGPQQRLGVWVDRLQVSSLPAVAGQWLPQKLNQQIAQGRLQGMLRDVVLSIDLEQPERLLLAGRAEGLSSQRFDQFPGVTNLDADFVAGDDRLGLQLRGEKLSLDFGEHFTAPLQIDSLQLDASLRRRQQTLMVSVDRLQLQNQDIEASGRMWMEADGDRAPFTYIRASFADGNGASAGKYIPRQITPAKTQAWLDRAIVSGRVIGGDMMFHGRLRDIRELARERAGEFFVDFGVERAEIDFSPGWLPARDAAGRVQFHNAGMSFDIDQVSYDQIRGAHASGSIPNFNEPVLGIKIGSEQDTARAVQTWLDTPVGKQYRQVMQNVGDLAGMVQTQVNLNVPLADVGENLRVRVLADFENASAVAESWGLELSQINGRLTVTESTISAPQIQAMFFGDPVSVEIETEAGTGTTLVNASGLIESRHLLHSLPEVFSSEVSGKSDWQVRIGFIDRRESPQRPFMHINAASNLRQTAITLPQPFAKVGDDELRVAADLDFFTDTIAFTASLGDTRRLRGNLVAADRRGYRIDALELALQNPLGETPADGFVLHGRWPEIEADGWIEILGAAGTARPGLVRSVNLQVERLRLYRRLFENARLELNRVDSRFIGRLDSSLAAGRFEVPLKPSRQDPILAELEFLTVEKLEQTADYSALRPGQFKDFRISSKSLNYHGMQFSDLELETRVEDNLLQVEKLSMRRDQVKISASGSWRFDPLSGAHESSLVAKIRGDQFGEAIAGIGFGDTMSGGKVKFDGGFTWPAPLFGFEPGSLTGDARLKIQDGVLNNVEPGSGRFVGLLSLSALPRRLSLDFSDVLVGGMEFDSITGRYRLEGGLIHTDNTRMDGPAAKIRISGKTDIVERSYDQQISVTPKIRQTLPLIGAVSAGSTVGWGLLLLQNLFKKAIDDAVEIEYRVSGSWDDPQIELIKAVDENQQELPEIGDRTN